MVAKIKLLIRQCNCNAIVDCSKLIRWTVKQHVRIMILNLKLILNLNYQKLADTFLFQTRRFPTNLKAT